VADPATTSSGESFGLNVSAPAITRTELRVAIIRDAGAILPDPIRMPRQTGNRFGPFEWRHVCCDFCPLSASLHPCPDVTQKFGTTFRFIRKNCKYIVQQPKWRAGTILKKKFLEKAFTMLKAMKAFSIQAYSSLRPFVWQIATAILILAFILIEVRPFERTAILDSEAVASAWNESISRLGIQPAFPPDEDIYVGDIWAVIVSSENKALLNRGVRVGHIDLRSDIVSAKKGAPLFANTPKMSSDEKYRALSRLEEIKTNDDADRISLTLAAFPGITITHTHKATGALGKIFGAGSDEQDTEEIRIPTAESYGAPARTAYRRFNEWCVQNENKEYCDSDAPIRAILAYAISPDVLNKSNGQYDTEVRLQLITRVFLMREIEHRRGRNRTTNLAVAVNSSTKSDTETSPGPGQQSANGNLSIDSSSRRATLARADSSGISLIEVFQRPLVFGFRALTAYIPPPKTEKKP
jgi:hypothetical protein